MMSGIVRAYSSLLRRHPFVSQSVQTGILMGTGDIIAQTLVDRKDLNEINLTRTAQFAGMGLFVVGPCLTMWYRVLDKYIGNKGTTAVAVKKVVLDQLGFTPVFVSVFLATLGGLQTKNLNESITRVKRDYRDVLSANYKLWPWVQLVNFYFVPLQYQVLLVQSVALFWNAYLSWKTQQQASQLIEQ